MSIKKKLFALASIACALTMVMATGCDTTKPDGGNSGDTDQNQPDDTQKPDDGNKPDDTDKPDPDEIEDGPVPEGYEKVETTLDVATLADTYGDNAKTSQEIKYGNFTFEAGLKFEKSKHDGGAVNTQGKTVTVKLTGYGKHNELSFDVETGASGKFTGVTVKCGEKVVFECGNENATCSLKELPRGDYQIISGGGACRLYKIKTVEHLEVSKPTEITVQPTAVDFLAGAKINTSGTNAAVKFENGATKSKTAADLDFDVSAVDTANAGEYKVKVSYEEQGVTVNGEYTVYVYALDSLAYYDYTTNGNKQQTLQTVYPVGAAAFNTAGLTVKAVGKLGEKTKEFTMAAAEYNITGFDASAAGEKTVTVTAKADGTKKAEIPVNIVEKVDPAASKLALTVDKSAAVSGTNFHSLSSVLSYLAALNLGADVVKEITVADGVYKEKVCIDLPNVHLLGSVSAPNATVNNGVIIEFDALSGGTAPNGATYGTNGSATVTVTANATGFEARYITFKNHYNTKALYDESKTLVGDTQAVALLVESPSATFLGCKFTSYHDTLYANKGKHYYQKCWIEGHTDFIFGQDAIAYFDDCDIYSIGAGVEESNGGYVTALKPSKATDNWYFVYNGCRFGADENTKDGSVALGRAWGADMKMVVINCEISGKYSTAAHVQGGASGQRYCTMSGNEPKPANMIEAGNTGAGAVAASVANTCTVDETAKTTYGLEKLAEILGFTPNKL